MMLRSITLLAAGAWLLTAGCGSEETRREDVKPGAADARRVGEETQPWTTLEGGTALRGEQLVIDVGYLPAAEPGQASIPQCLTFFAPETPVGELHCAASNQATQVITAGQVTQVCTLADEERSRQEPSEALTTPEDCDEIEVRAYVFTPAIRFGQLEAR